MICRRSRRTASAAGGREGPDAAHRRARRSAPDRRRPRPGRARDREPGHQCDPRHRRPRDDRHLPRRCAMASSRSPCAIPAAGFLPTTSIASSSRSCRFPTRPGGGAGLGLSISRRIVQAHGGQLAVRSQVGQGTTFTFTLPLAARASGVADRTRRHDASSGRRRRRTFAAGDAADARSRRAMRWPRRADGEEALRLFGDGCEHRRDAARPEDAGPRRPGNAAAHEAAPRRRVHHHGHRLRDDRARG